MGARPPGIREDEAVTRGRRRGVAGGLFTVVTTIVVVSDHLALGGSTLRTKAGGSNDVLVEVGPQVEVIHHRVG